MTDPAAITRDAIAAELARAWRGGMAADDTALPVGSAGDAYAIQHRLLALLGEPAGVPRHWKSGAADTTAPLLHAPLPARGVLASGADTARLVLRHHWFEAEVALRLGHAVTPADAQAIRTGRDALHLLDGMCVSIELVDSRWAAARAAAPLQKLADLLVHGALVLGDFVPFTARDWQDQLCRVRTTRGAWQDFRGSLGIADPAHVLPAWLAHATREGASVPAGTVVTTGTWCGLLQAQPGQTIEVEFPGIGAASVRLAAPASGVA